ncbi:MAG: hypothetical protein NTZ05_14460 [Chloroflexi bacterium]|nr:hypothetical protein [Chloroflexota bacterium]
MTSAITHLAESRADLRDELDRLANNAWLAIVWTLREVAIHHKYAPDQYPLTDVDVRRITEQIELLRWFLAGAVPDTSKWSSASLTGQLTSQLDYLEVQLDQNQDRPLAFHRDVVTVLQSFDANLGRNMPEAVQQLLQLAGTCFLVMDELEDLRRSLASSVVSEEPSSADHPQPSLERAPKPGLGRVAEYTPAFDIRDWIIEILQSANQDEIMEILQAMSPPWDPDVPNAAKSSLEDLSPEAVRALLLLGQKNRRG